MKMHAGLFPYYITGLLANIKYFILLLFSGKKKQSLLPVMSKILLINFILKKCLECTESSANFMLSASIAFHKLQVNRQVL